MTERTRARRRLDAAWRRLLTTDGLDDVAWNRIVNVRTAAMAYGRVAERARKARGAK